MDTPFVLHLDAPTSYKQNRYLLHSYVISSPGSGMYDYGKAEGLALAAKNGQTLLDFNFEQQASIIADYYDSLHKVYADNYKELLKQFVQPIINKC